MHVEPGVTLPAGVHLRTSRDYARIGPLGRHSRDLVLARYADGEYRYSTGCFLGTYQELRAACAQTHGVGSRHYLDYGAAATALWRLVRGDTPRPTTEEGK